MTDAYIRLEAKKNDIISMAATTNEACIWWLNENFYLMGKEWHFW